MPADFDGVLLEVGEFGRYQRMIVWLLCIPTCFVNAFNGFVFVFQAYTPEFRCQTESELSNGTIDFSNSNASQFDDRCYADDSINGSLLAQSTACHKFVYNQNYFRSTLITDWDLVCDQAIVWKNVLSFLNAMAIAGCFIYSYIQDRWGRKVCFLLSIAAYVFGGVASVFAPSPFWFAVLRTPWSLSSISTWNIGYIWALEYVGPSKRAYVTSVLSILYGVAAVVLAFVAWLSPTWIELGLMTTVPFVLLFSYYFFIDESPRWMLSQGRREETAKTLQKMARWQKIPPLSADTLKSLMKDKDDDDDETNIGGEKASKKASEKSKRGRGGFVLFQLFRRHNIRWKTVLITYTWISVSVVYNSIAYNVENLGGNFYVTYVLQACVEIPASIIAMFVLNRYGRLGPLFFSMLAAGVFSFAAIPAQLVAGEWGVIAAATASKFAICLSYCCIYLLAGELYPTTVRGLGTGFSSALGDMGNIFMPYIVHSAIVYEMLPMVILGAMSMLGALGCLFLPETKDQYLPETVDEAELHGLVRMETFKRNWRNFFYWRRGCARRNSVLDTPDTPADTPSSVVAN